MFNWQKVTRKELLALPRREWGSTSIHDQLIIFPSAQLHDSGYRNFVVIGCDLGSVNAVVISECSDSLNFSQPSFNIKPAELQMDCFPRAQVTRYWSNGHRFKVGRTLSSLYITMVAK